MIRITRCILAVALSALAIQTVEAQWNMARFDTNRRSVYTTSGLDPALVTSVGMSNVGSLMGHDVQMTGEVGVVTASLDARDFRARLGLQTSLVRWHSMSLNGSATFITRGTDNSVYRGLNFGADFSGALGMYRPRWFAAADGGFDKAVITHVTHTDWYRANVYPDAKNGWYLDAGGTYHYGLSGGVTVGRAELIARLGFLKSEDYNSLTPPMYGTIGVGFGY